MRKPIIGITCNTLLVDGAIQPGITRIFVNTPYVDAISLAGGIPLLLPPVTNPTLICDQVSTVDGLILSGGPDVNPLLYKEEPLTNLGTVNHARDQYEVQVVQAAEKLNKPLLGICRGIQMINVVYGGTLYQDLSDIDGCNIKHLQSVSQFNALWHSVDIQPTSMLAQIVGKNKLIVNSYHHQALKTVAPGFAVTAHAKDNVIEAIECQGNHFILGVQWHPELLAEKYTVMLSLFQDLVKRA